MSVNGLGRRLPTDYVHVTRYPIRATLPETVASVERKLDVNSDWRRRYDQGQEGACVGFAWSFAMSILNRVFYDAPWLYRSAQAIDEWPDTPPADGTSVRAGGDVLRTLGHRRYRAGTSGPTLLEHGIEENRWATTVDEMRTCLANGIPVVLGCWWFPAFDEPEEVRRWFGLRQSEWWIGRNKTALWRPRGGHAICVYGASDSRQAFALVNSWGLRYPLVWMPYETMQHLLDRDGEATVIVDRVPGGTA